MVRTFTAHYYYRRTTGIMVNRGPMISPLGILEAVYEDAESEAEWLSGIARAASRGGERPVFVYTYHSSPARGVRFGSKGDAGPIFDGWWDALRSSVKKAKPEAVDAFFRYVRPLRSAIPTAPDASTKLWLGELFAETLTREVRISTLTDPCGHGVAFGFPLMEDRKLPSREQATLRALSVHIGAAYRLRRAVGGRARDAFDLVEGVVAPDGRVLHASGPAKSRAGLTKLARAAEARNRLRLGRASAEEALELWRALILGRWTLVDHVERDGKRLLLARRNEPHVTEPRALAPLERAIFAFAALGHPNKLIAYELGVSPNTVSEYLSRALRKLGFKSRIELVATMRTRAPSRSRAR